LAKVLSRRFIREKGGRFQLEGLGPKESALEICYDPSNYVADRQIIEQRSILVTLEHNSGFAWASAKKVWERGSLNADDVHLPGGGESNGML